MKKIILLFCFISFISCYEAERNCSDFKTGTFRFEFTTNGVKRTGTFVRTEKMEIETFEGKTDTSTIRWVNDCEYVVQLLHPKNIKERNAISMKILTTSKNSYTFEYGETNKDERLKGTAIKIK
jgi:hypothetical protein